MQKQWWQHRVFDFISLESVKDAVTDASMVRLLEEAEALDVKCVHLSAHSPNIYSMTEDDFPFLCLPPVCCFLPAKHFFIFSTNATLYAVSIYPSCSPV